MDISSESLLIPILTAVISNNFVFSKAFGVSTMIAAAKNKRLLRGICIGVCYFSVTSSAAAWAVQTRTALTDSAYIPLLYTVIIGSLYAVTLIAARIFFSSKFERMKKYVHISAFNSVVMGTIFLCSRSCTELREYLTFGICSGVGFSAAALMLSGVYPVIYSKNTPRAFRGFPGVMIFTGIISMAVRGIMGG